LCFITPQVGPSHSFVATRRDLVSHRMVPVILEAPAQPDALPVAERPRPASAHVRAVSDVARQTLADALSRSSTVARLVRELNATDVIVFVDTRVDPAIPTAETMLMAATASVRYVHVILNPRMTFDERVEYLGHELQHAIEIAQDAAAIDSASVRRRFASIGREVPSASPREKSYETEGARLVSSLVRRELMAPRRASGPR
jgi:hypothetical protein